MDAVNRINNEYFFRRDNSEICRQNAGTGEIQVVTQQQLKTALAGRWVEGLPPLLAKWVSETLPQCGSKAERGVKKLA